MAAAAGAVVAAWRAAVEAVAAAAAAAATTTTTAPLPAAKRAASPAAPAQPPEKKARASGGEAKPRPVAVEPEPPGEAGPPPPSCGDPARDRARGLLAAALALVPASARVAGRPPPGDVAAEVETAVHAWAAAGGGDAAARAARGKAKLRSLVFNLRDPGNPDTRARVLAGTLAPADLVTAKPEQLASDARKEENERIRREALFEAERGQVREKTGRERWRRVGWRRRRWVGVCGGGGRGGPGRAGPHTPYADRGLTYTNQAPAAASSPRYVFGSAVFGRED